MLFDILVKVKRFKIRGHLIQIIKSVYKSLEIKFHDRVLQLECDDCSSISVNQTKRRLNISLTKIYFSFPANFCDFSVSRLAFV